MNERARVDLTKRYRFAAAHVLRSRALTEAENERTYGKCANPAGHGHNYVLEITVSGALDAGTGELVPPEWLDAQVESHLLHRLRHCMLNEDPWFAERVPTAEEIAEVAREVLSPVLAEHSGLTLRRVRLHETRRNTFECGVPD